MLDSITGNTEVNRLQKKKVENMGILRKYEYRSTWVRFADLPAETGAIADWDTTGTTRAGKKEERQPWNGTRDET